MTRPNLHPEEEIYLSTAPDELDDDCDVLDDIPGGTRRRGRDGISAWQQVERRAENRWLREQLTDWDDFDDRSLQGL